MKRRFLIQVIFVLSLFMAVPQSMAQSDAGKSPLQLRNAMGSVLIAGLVGGVLGLSTLSFYDRPQDNIRNIFFGAGAAMMIATVVMTAEVADQPIPVAKFFEIKNEPQSVIVWAPALDPSGKSAGLALSAKF